MRVLPKSVVVLAIAGIIGILILKLPHDLKSRLNDGPKTTATIGQGEVPLSILKTLKVATPHSRGYLRTKFGPAWADVDGNHCDTRDDVLAAHLTHITKRGACIVLTGTLVDLYTDKTMAFRRGPGDDVQIDHVVSLGNAWASGAWKWTPAQREAFANDPANLQPVDLHNNEQKGDKSAARWLPPAGVCKYATIQVTIKAERHLTITRPEHDALVRALHTCPKG